MPKRSVQPFVERALAFANAAVDEPTEQRIRIARIAGKSALERVRSGDAARGEPALLSLVAELRAVLFVLERRAAAPFNPFVVN